MIELADHSSAYGRGRDKRERPQADPLGRDGFPDYREDLDHMVVVLCDLLAGEAPAWISGKRLSLLFWPHDRTGATRSLRLLTAYARVHRHKHQIVGLPGQGYVWADEHTQAGREILQRAVAMSTRMGRCFFYTAALHRRQGIAMAAVQLVFDFMEHQRADRPNDDLAALFASEGTSIQDFLDRFVAELARSEEGRQVLRETGRRHASVLVSADMRAAWLATLDHVSGQIAQLRQGLVDGPSAA